jgi:hypothetical protein
VTPEGGLIVDAFKAVCCGYSADRIIVDPELNAAFVQKCQTLGLTSPPTTLNRRLLNIRKRGLLPCPEQRVITAFPNDEEYRFASEIAARILQRRDGHSLDTILCDPNLCRELDKLAMDIAPGFSPLEYRWAALNLRKSRKLTPEILGRVIQSQSILTFRVSQISDTELPSEQGLYIFYNPPETLYVGEASNLRARLKKHLDHSDNRGLARWIWEHGVTNVLLEIHVLPAETPTPHRRALETELIRSRDPAFNVQR